MARAHIQKLTGIRSTAPPVAPWRNKSTIAVNVLTNKLPSPARGTVNMDANDHEIQASMALP